MTPTDDKPMTVDALMEQAISWVRAEMSVDEFRSAIEQYGRERERSGFECGVLAEFKATERQAGRGRDEPVAYRVLAYGRTQKVTVRLDVADEWASNCRNSGAVGVEVQPLYTAPQSREPVAHMFPSDLERFAKEETKAFAFSVAVSCADERSVPLFLGSQQQPGEPLTDEPSCDGRE